MPKAGVQKVIRIGFDRETVDRLANGQMVRFPMNEEGTQIVEVFLNGEEAEADTVQRGIQ